MSIRELTCPAHGHPVGPDDAYCGVCGAAVYISPVGARQTWPMLVPVPDPEPVTASITPIRPPVEFKPLDFAVEQSRSYRRAVGLALAVLATVACVSLLIVSEVQLDTGNNRSFWSTMWLAWYGATAVAAAGWFYGLIQWARRRTWRGSPDT